VFGFFQVAVTYPLLFCHRRALTPWQTLTALSALPKLLTIVARCFRLVGSGFVWEWVNLYPIDTAM